VRWVFLQVSVEKEKRESPKNPIKGEEKRVQNAREGIIIGRLENKLLYYFK